MERHGQLAVNHLHFNVVRLEWQTIVGGELVGLYNFTMDGGDGVDDYLVALSRAGDVVIYRGDDPSLIDLWNIVGTFYVGELPAERRVANEYGGDLYIISVFGMISAAA